MVQGLCSKTYCTVKYYFVGLQKLFEIFKIDSAITKVDISFVRKFRAYRFYDLVAELVDAVCI